MYFCAFICRKYLKKFTSMGILMATGQGNPDPGEGRVVGFQPDFTRPLDLFIDL
jgi:hypothetical protein